MINKIYLFVVFLSFTFITLSAQASMVSSERFFVREVVNPEYIDAQKAIYEIRSFLDGKIIYPTTRIMNEEQGNILLSITIDVDGTILSKQINVGDNNDFGRNILGAISDLTKVTPILIDDIPVKRTIDFPIKFILD